MSADLERKVRDLTSDKLTEDGLELLDVEFKEGSLRLTLDSETLLDLDRVAQASILISKLIDESPFFDELGSFNLEVSSPGVERTLRTEAHFRRFIGSKVSFKTKSNVPGPRRFTGLIKRTVGSTIFIELDDSSLGISPELDLDVNDIERARTIFAWGSPKPPKTKSKGGPRRTSKSNLTPNKIAKD